MNPVPKHVAIIMDGNRRWARQRGLHPIVGHRQGVKTIENIMESAREIGVSILTLYAFSTENWNRTKTEVGALMNLLELYLKRESKRLVDNDIRLMTIGDLSSFRASLRAKIDKVKDLTKDNSTLVLNLALNYGGRDEIVRALRSISHDTKSGKISLDEINEKLVSERLYTKELPDPELLIRTGGESRISNFLLWQISYAEICVVKKFWPDFGKKDFKKVISEYQAIDRRLGV